jgi:hypothetical protein
MSTVTRAYLDQRLAVAKRCSRGSSKKVFSFSLHTLLSISDTGCFAEATLAGAKAAAVATVASAVPTVSLHHLHLS